MAGCAGSHGFLPNLGRSAARSGTLGGVPVLQVVDAEENKVVHYTSAAIAPGPVRGRIDWTRRIDHMQQHTGQHLLSAAFVDLFHFPTVSFHLGREASTIDLEAPSMVSRHLEEAERRTNEIIFEDRVVAVRFGTAEEFAEAGIRKKVDREGILRAIEVEGFDRQPCGGTHLARTGQAGLLLIRGIERRRDLWRVEFVCGSRALEVARRDFAVAGGCRIDPELWVEGCSGHGREIYPRPARPAQRDEAVGGTADRFRGALSAAASTEGG